MSRSAPEPAADADAPAPAAAKKVLTRVKLDEDARTRVLLRKHAHDAATWAHENNVGVRKAISTGNFGGATRNMVHPLLKERHFHSEFGLEAELIDASIMDPETKMIRDPRRVLNVDETPQPLDAPQKGSRKKVAKRQGKAVRKATATSKESLSINMTWDLAGHLYGVQLKLKELHNQLVCDV